MATLAEGNVKFVDVVHSMGTEDKGDRISLRIRRCLIFYFSAMDVLG